MRQQCADYRVFWREFRHAYQSTGAVLPSGRSLAGALAHFVRDGDSHVDESLQDSETAAFATANLRSEKLPYVGRRILEVGPGTGTVTGQIIKHMRPVDRLVLVERNEQFVARLQARLAGDCLLAQAGDRITLLHASVEDMSESEPFELIISGLPLNNFSVQLVEQILSKLRRLLAPSGTLSFFEYVAVRRAKRFVNPGQRERLSGIDRVFGELLGVHEIRRDLVLANMPPAWVHHVRFAAGGTGHGAGSKTSDPVPPAPCPMPQ